MTNATRTARKAGRTERVQVSLTEDAADRLRTEADRRGLAPSTLCAAIVGEFLAGKDCETLAGRRFPTVEKAQ